MEYGDSAMTDFKRDGSHLASCPPVEKWDDWVELDPEAWPRRVKSITSLFRPSASTANRRAGFSLTSIRKPGQVAKFEGNPKHPASRGRLCAKGRPRSRRFTIPIAFFIR
jgi:hypothetical protein